MRLHPDELVVDAETVRALLAEQAPQWAGLPLRSAGAGTDNQMFRLGEELLVRLPRRPGTAADVAKEQTWLARLGPQLPLQIPTPVLHGRPAEHYRQPWSVYRWIDGETPTAGTVTDWADFGSQLAGFVQQLHALDTAGATRTGPLAWYRGKPLRELADDGWRAIEEIRAMPGFGVPGGPQLDLDAAAALWRTAVTADDPARPDGWLHGDLRSANLLTRQGRLVAVLDFGTLCLGNPTAEHAAIWEYPAAARTAYRSRLGLDEPTWLRARGWKLLVSLLSIPYYWDSWREFARSGLESIDTLLREPV